MVNRLIKTIICLFVFNVIINVANAAEIKLTLDRDTVSKSDSVTLFFQAIGSVDDDPDFSPLEKDFSIIGKQKRTNLSIINGKRTSSTEWLVEVMATRDGELLIPAINFGIDQSPSAKLVVSNAPVVPDQDKENQDVFIEVEAMPQETWVQSQVIFTIKLFRSINTFNSSLSEATINGGQVIVEKLEDRQFETSRNGKHFVVLQRRYALFPQASGKFIIEPIVFSGQVSQRSRQLFDAFGRQGQTIKRFSSAIELNVKPIPTDYSGKTWLPAKKLEINEKWMKDNLQLVAGEPVTRIVVIKADGLTSEQLPEINTNDLIDFKIYPDQPELHNQTSTNGVLGIRQEKSAVIPNDAGEYVLPAIDLKWWNTLTGEMEIAQLPERVINVLPSVNDQGIADDQIDQNKNVIPEQIEKTVEEESNTMPTLISNYSESHWKYWPWVALFLALGWISTLFAWWNRNRSVVSAIDVEASERSKNVEASSRSILRNLKEAVRKDDPVAIKNALLDWTGSIWKENTPKSLTDIAALCEQSLSDQLLLLSESLYGNTDKKWDGDQLLTEVENFDRSKFQEGKLTDQKGLKPLHNI